MENVLEPPLPTTRFSNASLLTLASVATILPQYSATDGPEGLPVFQGDPPHGSPASTTVAQGFSSPPRYSVNNPRHSVSPGCRFEYSYPIRPNKPWATLQLHTRDKDPGRAMPLPCQPKIPRFWSCDPVSGVLQLDLDGPQTIQHVGIVIKGKLVTSARSEGTFLFLESEFTLWDKSFGNPLQYRTNHTQNSPDKTTDGKFIAGQYTFPFSFPFPIEAEQTTKSSLKILSRLSSTAAPPLSTDASSRYSNSSERVSTASSEDVQSRTSLASHIPQTFTENAFKVSIVYEIAVCFVHGIFRAKSKIKTNFFYIPALEPHATPRRRREAYEAGALLPGPMNDPAGWFALPKKVIIHGTINESQQPTKVDCTLHIAEPLSYTRGSVIPCFLTLFSKDTEALRLPNVPVVRLCRRVRHLTTSGEELPAGAGGAFDPSAAMVTHVPIPEGELKLVIHEVATAQWWTPPKDVFRDRNVGHLEGEIHLSPELLPTCDFQLFHVEYFVEILSFKSVNFEVEMKMGSGGKSREQEDVLASTPVDIVTIYREDEPVPTPYSERPSVLRVAALE